MNKLKTLYDVVKTMKNKELLQGTLTVQVQKDEEQLFSLLNEFEKNLRTGKTYAKINSEFNYDGKTVKHESSTEFEMSQSIECKHHEWIHHLHHSRFSCGGGVKAKMSKLIVALSILNALQIEEQADKTLIISLAANDLPADTVASIREKINNACACHHAGHSILKECCQTDHLDFALNILVNQNNEVANILITLVSTRKDTDNVPHDMTARTELSFIG